MRKMRVIKKPVHQVGERRLSPWRVMLAILILSGVITGGFFGLRQWKAEQPVGTQSPWFAAYVDVTATPTFAFDQIGSTTNRDAVLSFIVSSQNDACTPSWGSVYTLDQAGESLDLDRRIARLQQQEGSIAVSFGGLLNDELAVKCTDADKLYEAYKAVVERYDIDTIDLDLEQGGLSDLVAGERRAEAVARLQAERRSKNKNLAVWVTLPVTPQGLSVDGTNGVKQLLSGKVDLAGVNAMTMDYGNSKAQGQDMKDASISALKQTHRQLGILYSQAGIELNNATLWSKIGATPMIGQNDVPGEVFTLADAEGLNKFALDQGIGRMSMWSANRDLACGSNYVDTKIVSDSCSGVVQDKFNFAEILGEGFDGSLTSSSGSVTTSDSNATELPDDDPATSPYQIWSDSGTYLAGTKVVWHRNVYKAKWWTQGNMPDDPVLQTWETPWELIGPVLPGEKPIQQFTLPPGTYPDWSGSEVYDANVRVLFDGIPYQSKWWNHGESPAAASSDPNGSPWSPLTQAQINELIAQ
jgi:chitinase